MSATPGAHPQDVGYDQLLPDGKRWQYDLVLPDDVSKDDVLRLEVRRFLIDEANQGIRGQERMPMKKPIVFSQVQHLSSGRPMIGRVFRCNFLTYVITQPPLQPRIRLNLWEALM